MYHRRILIVASILVQFLLIPYGTAHAAPNQAKTFIIGEITNVPSSASAAFSAAAATPAATAASAATPAVAAPIVATTNGAIGDRRLSLHAALEKIGYVEGQNVTYMFDPNPAVFSTPDKLNAGIQKLIDAKVDIIVAYGTSSAIAVQKMTAGTDMPVVFVGSADPVQLGIVKSLQNTEGNVTGVGGSSNAYAKQLEWLVRIIPTIKRVYMPIGPTNVALSAAALKAVQEYAAKSGIEVVSPTINTEAEATTAIANLSNIDAVILTPGSAGQSQFFQAGKQLKLPVTTSFPNIMDAGPLLSFNYTEQAVGTEAARYVDRILRGAKPSDLPIQIASNSLALNLKTAQTIGLPISNDILQQAGIIVR
ncbi:MAG: ABC transporter substrate-binding protein [Chloroflexota bacterium]